ncbi:MAG: hypothetical protein AVO39_07845 [delta proteobacterium MLS_D]|jgi:flagellar biosynthesis protein FliR|nr:MAG: hypothetical protein AVO39_07845 [delta proteobacterium MLS_D]
MDIMHLTASQLEQFILVFLRVSAIIASMPVIGNRSVPVRVKGGLSILMTVIIAPAVAAPQYADPSLPFLIRAAGEVIIGLIIGIAAQCLFAAVQLGGQVVGFQMGFAIVNVVDPLSSAQVSVIAQFCFFVSMLIFLAVDGHHVFLYGIAESFRIVPLMTFCMTGGLTEAIIQYARSIFTVGLSIGAPVMVLLLFTSVGLGMVARTVPQINIFIVGFPLKIGIGLIAIGITLPFMGRVIGAAFSDFAGVLGTFLEHM